MSEPPRKMSSHLNIDRDQSTGHRKSLSGSILSKLYFLRSNGDNQATSTEREHNVNTSTTTSNTVTGTESGKGGLGVDRGFSKKSTRSIAAAVQQNSRRRKGSLRKTALLGRGAQREKKEMKSSMVDTGNKKVHHDQNSSVSHTPLPSEEQKPFSHLGLGMSNGSRLEECSTRADKSYLSPITTLLPMGKPDQHVTLPTTVTSPTLSYTSTTTDDEEIISIQNRGFSSRTPGSASDSYFPPDAVSIAHHRSVKQAKSPLSIAGLAQNPLPASESEWDYSETEWWGWVLLFVTWIVFVVGMGSCLGVWSWAWDVGETPYAPPELEDDPTLPIVGYYPALIILTSVMAWVWVIVAWVGMKYFRHTKISGD